MVLVDDRLHDLMENIEFHWVNLVSASGLYEDVVNQIVDAPLIKYCLEQHLPLLKEREERIKALQVGLVVSVFYLGHNYIYKLLKTSVISTVEASILVYTQINYSLVHQGNEAQTNNITVILGAYVNTHAFSLYPSDPVHGKNVVVTKLALSDDWVDYFNRQYNAHAGAIETRIH